MSKIFRLNDGSAVRMTTNRFSRYNSASELSKNEQNIEKDDVEFTTLSEYALLQATRFSGDYESWHKNGHIAEHANYIDGVRYGLYEYWYPNGRLGERVTYKDGNFDGLYEEWYENGQLRFHTSYKNGKIDGLCEAWYVNGQQNYRINYKNGKIDGLYEKWYENGDKKVIETK